MPFSDCQITPFIQFKGKQWEESNAEYLHAQEKGTLSFPRVVWEEQEALFYVLFIKPSLHTIPADTQASLSALHSHVGGRGSSIGSPAPLCASYCCVCPSLPKHPVSLIEPIRFQDDVKLYGVDFSTTSSKVPAKWERRITEMCWKDCGALRCSQNKSLSLWWKSLHVQEYCNQSGMKLIKKNLVAEQNQ